MCITPKGRGCLVGCETAAQVQGKIPTVGRVSLNGVTFKSIAAIILANNFSPVLIFPWVEPVHSAGRWLLGLAVPVSPGSVLCWTARTEKWKQGIGPAQIHSWHQPCPTRVKGSEEGEQPRPHVILLAGSVFPRAGHWEAPPEPLHPDRCYPSPPAPRQTGNLSTAQHRHAQLPTALLLLIPGGRQGGPRALQGWGLPAPHRDVVPPTAGHR